MKRFVELAGGALEGAEFTLSTCAALLLVAVGPVIWCRSLLTANRVVWAVVVAVLWLGSIIVVAREVRRKALTLVSFGVFLAWVLGMLWVFHNWFVTPSGVACL